MENWIKSEDQKPTVNTEVLTAWYNGIWFYNLTLWDGKEWRCTYDNFPCSVDYWKHISEPLELL